AEWQPSVDPQRGRIRSAAQTSDTSLSDEHPRVPPSPNGADDTICDVIPNENVFVRSRATGSLAIKEGVSAGRARGCCAACLMRCPARTRLRRVFLPSQVIWLHLASQGLLGSQASQGHGLPAVPVRALTRPCSSP